MHRIADIVALDLNPAARGRFTDANCFANCDDCGMSVSLAHCAVSESTSGTLYACPRCGQALATLDEQIGEAGPTAEGTYRLGGFAIASRCGLSFITRQHTAQLPPTPGFDAAPLQHGLDEEPSRVLTRAGRTAA